MVYVFLSNSYMYTKSPSGSKGCYIMIIHYLVCGIPMVRKLMCSTTNLIQGFIISVLHASIVNNDRVTI